MARERSFRVSRFDEERLNYNHPCRHKCRCQPRIVSSASAKPSSHVAALSPKIPHVTNGDSSRSVESDSFICRKNRFLFSWRYAKGPGSTLSFWYAHLRAISNSSLSKAMVYRLSSRMMRPRYGRNVSCIQLFSGKRVLPIPSRTCISPSAIRQAGSNRTAGKSF